MMKWSQISGVIAISSQTNKQTKWLTDTKPWNIVWNQRTVFVFWSSKKSHNLLYLKHGELRASLRELEHCGWYYIFSNSLQTIYVNKLMYTKIGTFTKPFNLTIWLPDRFGESTTFFLSNKDPAKTVLKMNGLYEYLNCINIIPEGKIKCILIYFRISLVFYINCL